MSGFCFSLSLSLSAIAMFVHPPTGLLRILRSLAKSSENQKSSLIRKAKINKVSCRVALQGALWFVAKWLRTNWDCSEKIHLVAGTDLKYIEWITGVADADLVILLVLLRIRKITVITELISFQKKHQVLTVHHCKYLMSIVFYLLSSSPSPAVENHRALRWTCKPPRGQNINFFKLCPHSVGFLQRRTLNA